MRLHQVEFTEIKDGIRQWHLLAAQVDYERRTGLGLLTGGVQATFYSQKGEPLVVCSERGSFHSKEKDIDLFGHVRATAPPYRLFSDTLHYDPKGRTLTTEGPARLESAEMSMSGTGLSYELDSRQLWVHQAAQTTSYEPLF